jgi:hypothetical protein
MTSASIRRRLHNLETTYARVELHRIEKQSPIIDGGFLIRCHRGQISGKRYIGVDLAADL